MRKSGTASQYKGKIEYTKLKELDKEIGADFSDDLTSSETQIEVDNGAEETLYLNSIPGLVESIKAADCESLESMETYKPDEER